MGLEKLPAVETLLSRESIEVTENDSWTIDHFGLRDDYFKLGQLSVARRVRIDVRVKEPNTMWTN